MKLQKAHLTIDEKLAEFDQWLTAKLDNIKDSTKFNREIAELSECINILKPYLDNFSDHQKCSVEKLCDAVLQAAENFLSGKMFIEDEKNVAAFFTSFFNLLFLTTGATDNNLKNHFLIKLKEDDIRPLIPKRRGISRAVNFRLEPIPPVTRSDLIAKSLAACFVGRHEKFQDIVTTEPIFDLESYLRIFLNEYVSLILENNEEVMQFWAICHSFVSLNQLSPEQNLGKCLLNSCTIFKVRGSVAASAGHIPEDILRTKLISIGLKPEIDFNINDVKVGEEEIVENGSRKKKTRAYDFILPFNVSDWEPKPKLFIQAQFYAGDSGSVSHKVVDQTRSSRDFTSNIYRNAKFIEYLDGAGYYASLRGDLEHMLSFDNTASFFQVKSILVRLRRELQEIEFLTPVELEHAILTSENAHLSEICISLEKDGYPKDEISRIISVSIDMGHVKLSSDKLEISDDRVAIARRLLILDIAANHVSSITEDQRRSQKYLLIPGFGPNHGVLESALTEMVCENCKQIAISAPIFAGDIEWLLDEGVVRRH